MLVTSMAAGSTLYNFEIELSDPGRGVYEKLTLRAARHPSETLDYLLTRVLAYCLEYRDGLEFTKGLDEPEMPAIWAHDLTGRLIAWIEVGSPSAEKLHRASKAVEHIAVYTYKNLSTVLAQFDGENIHRSEAIYVYRICSDFLEEVTPFVERRNIWTLTVSEGHLYLTARGQHFNGQLECVPVVSEADGRP